MISRPDAQMRAVHDEIFNTFRDLGVSEADLKQVKDTFLIQDGKYCGRSFRAGGILAMWMLEIGLVQIYDAEGKLLKTLTAQPAPPLQHKPRRKAA